MYQQSKQLKTINSTESYTNLLRNQYLLIGNQAALVESAPDPIVIQRFTDATIQADYAILENFVMNHAPVLANDLANAVIHIDPRMTNQATHADAIETRARQLFQQAPLNATRDALNMPSLLKLHADQNAIYTDATADITQMDNPAGERQVLIGDLGNNVMLYVSSLLPDPQLAINAIIEGISRLAHTEQQYLQQTHTEIHVHSITAHSGTRQQGIWTYDDINNIHRGDIFISGNMAPMSVPKTIDNLQGSTAGQKAIIKHELGHLLHAILHSSDFRMTTLIDESHDTLKTNRPIGAVLNNIPPNQTLNQWGYAGMHSSIREFVTEIFVCLTSGIPVSAEQYDWYIAHGGPEIAGRITTVTHDNHFQVV